MAGVPGNRGGAKGRSGGHNRLPTAVKQLQGTLDRRGHNAREPTVEPMLPDPPAWLDKRALTHYWEVGRMANDLQVIARTDRNALALCAMALLEYLDACKAVSKYELMLCNTDTTISKDGKTLTRITIKINPAVAARADAWRRHTEGLRYFGLNPQARASVATIGGGAAVAPTGDAGDPADLVASFFDTPNRKN